MARRGGYDAPEVPRVVSICGQTPGYGGNFRVRGLLRDSVWEDILATVTPAQMKNKKGSSLYFSLFLSYVESMLRRVV